MVDLREGETTAGGMTVATALSSRGRMNSNKDRRELWRCGRAHSGSGGEGVDGVVVAARASHARDSRRLMVDKPAHERRRVVAVAAIGSRQQIIMQSGRGLTDGTESIVTRLTREGMPRQDTMIENTAQVETGGVVANVTGLSDAARSDVVRQRVRMRRRILACNRHTIQQALAIVAAPLTAGAR